MKRLLLLLIFIVLSLAICMNPTKYYPLNNEEIDNFCKENNIIPIDYLNANQFTVILFEKGETQQGHCVVYKDNRNKIDNTFLVGDVVSKKKNPIYTGGVATGESFLTIIINDEELIKNTNSIVVNFNDSSSIKKIINKGSIIFTDNKKWMLIELYDINSTLIYKMERIGDE